MMDLAAKTSRCSMLCFGEGKDIFVCVSVLFLSSRLKALGSLYVSGVVVVISMIVVVF